MTDLVQANCIGFDTIQKFGIVVNNQDKPHAARLLHKTIRENHWEDGKTFVIRKRGDTNYDVKLCRANTTETHRSKVTAVFQEKKSSGDNGIIEVIGITDTSKTYSFKTGGKWQVLEFDPFAPIDEEEKYKTATAADKAKVLNAFIAKAKGIANQNWFDEDNVPVIGLTHSTGGLHSEIFSIGVLEGLIEAGLAQAITYHTGASGGCWAVGLASCCGWNTELMNTKLGKGCKLDYKGIFASFLSQENIQDIFKKQLETQVGGDRWDPTLAQKVQDNNLPIPIMTVCRLYEKEETVSDEASGETIEFTPYWMFFDKLGLKINPEALDWGYKDIMVASGYVFSIPLKTFTQYCGLSDQALGENAELTLANQIHIENIAKKRTNPQDKHFYPQKDVLNLTDAGVVSSVPFKPLLRRNVDFMLITTIKDGCTRKKLVSVLENLFKNDKYKKLSKNFRELETETNKELFTSDDPNEAGFLVLNRHFENFIQNTCQMDYNDDELQKLKNEGKNAIINNSPRLADHFIEMSKRKKGKLPEPVDGAESVASHALAAQTTVTDRALVAQTLADASQTSAVVAAAAIIYY